MRFYLIVAGRNFSDDVCIRISAAGGRETGPMTLKSAATMRQTMRQMQCSLRCVRKGRRRASL